MQATISCGLTGPNKTFTYLYMIISRVLCLLSLVLQLFLMKVAILFLLEKTGHYEYGKV